MSSDTSRFSSAASFGEPRPIRSVGNSIRSYSEQRGSNMCTQGLSGSRGCFLAAAALAVAGCMSGGIATASVSIAVGNASFEDNSTASPGYGAITDWSSTNTSYSGVNNNTEPFALNTNIPDQSQVGFIQDSFGKTAVLSQSLA